MKTTTPTFLTRALRRSLLGLGCWLLSLCAATAQNWTSAVGAGGTNIDRGRAVAVDAAGNRYVTGVFYSSSVSFGAAGTLTNAGGAAGSADMFVVKYNASGTPLWARSVGGAGEDAGSGIAVDGGGNVVVSGDYSGSVSFGAAGTLASVFGGQDVFVVKYDTNGTPLWARSGGGANPEISAGIAVDGSGNVVMTGHFSSPSVTFGAAGTLTNVGGYNVFVVKYDTNGTPLWARSAGGASSDISADIAVDGSGNAVVTGYYAGSMTFGAAGTITSAGGNDAFVAKYDASGTPLWVRSIGGLSAEGGSGVAADASGNVAVAGYFNGSATFGAAGTLTNVGGSYDMFLVKYDASGTPLWARSSGGTGTEISAGIAVDASGNFAVTGYFQGAASFGAAGALTNAGGADIFVVKYDASGTPLWARGAGGTATDNGNALAVDASGNFAVTGYFGGSTPFGTAATLTSVGNNDIFLATVGLPPAVAPTVSAPTSASVTNATATLGGNVTSDGGGTVTERGVVYSLTSANANPLISGSGVAQVTASGTTGVFTAPITGLIASSGYSFKAYAINSLGTSYTSVATFTTLAPPNAAPTDIALSASSIAENNAVNATIGTLSATDANVGDTHTFSFATGGADNSSFTIVGNALKLTPSADFETKSSYAIKIRATDNGVGSLFFEKNFTVTITDVTIPQTITFGALGGKTFGDAAFDVSATGGASGQSVTFSIFSGPATIAGSTVTLTGAGSVTVRASQAGAGDYSAAASVDQSFSVAKAAQSISFTNPGARTFGDAAFALVATGGGSGNAVTFSVVSGPASIAGNLLTITGAGSITVRASQAGNADYFAAADVEETFSAAKAAQSISFTNPGARTFGDAAFALVATGGGSGNAVTFSVVSGPASIAGNLLTITGAGSITVRASQAGNADYFAATDADQTFTAAKAAQSISFTNPGARTFGDAAFALVATGGGSGEAVTFSVVSGSASVAGSTLTITGVGSITVRASQAGNADYFAAADVEETFSVAQAGQTITFGPLGGKAYGDAPFNVSATGGASGQPVTFSIFSGPATVSGNEVTITGVGTVVVRASQAGNANYEAAADVDQSFTVGKGTQTITYLTNPPANVLSTDVITLEASGGDSGNAVTFSVFSGPGSIAGDVLTFTGAGTVVVRASQAGDANYEAAADVDQTISVELNHAPVAVDDAVTTTTGDTTLYPLANDTDADGDLLSIASVSDTGVTISGRALIIPQGTGSFTYEVTDGSATDTGTVTVVAGTPLVAPTAWTGLLYAANGDIAGHVNLTKSATGICTAVLKVGAQSKSVRFMLNSTGEGTATIELGTLTATQEAVTDRMTFSLVSGGDTLSGSLRPAKRTATAEQHNIALASVDAAVPGGGYARAFVKADGVIVVTGVLPDGRPFTHKTRLSDNGSFAIYTVVSKTQTTGIVGGEFVTANLTSTDVTGELAWAMGAQASGLHAGGVNTTLTANGCIYTPAATLPAGAVTLTASGGNLAAPLVVATTATDGLPLASVAFPGWKVSVSRAVRTGLFGAKVKDPARARVVTGGGVYLPKSNSAWGYFPGTSEGGRIQLTQP